jgi:hypothetical protein
VDLIKLGWLLNVTCNLKNAAKQKVGQAGVPECRAENQLSYSEHVAFLIQLFVLWITHYDMVYNIAS